MICAFLIGYATGEVTGGLPTSPAVGPAGAGASLGDVEFDADLDDLVRLIEVAVRVG